MRNVFAHSLAGVFAMLLGCPQEVVAPGPVVAGLDAWVADAELSRDSSGADMFRDDVPSDALADRTPPADVWMPDAAVEIADGTAPPVVVVPTDSGAWLATTTHYAVTATTSGAQAGLIAQLLEASWDDFTAFFDGAEPTESPLAVHLYATAAEFHAHVTDEDGGPVQGGGYYDQGTKTASLFVQPSPYYTRSLALHEAAHQFHHLARLGSGADTPGWYDEGIAAYLQLYDWDGVGSTLGVVALATLEDYPAAGMADLQAATDLAAVIDGAANFTYPMVRLVVAFLHETRTEAFRAFRQDMDDGLDGPLALFEHHIGDPAAVRSQVLAWAPSAQEPFEIIYLQWTHVGPTSIHAEVESGIISYIVAERPMSSLTASVDVGDVEEKAGLVLAYQDADHYTMATIDSAGLFEVVTITAGTWEWDESTSLALTGSVTITATGGLVTVNGSPYGPYALGPGTPGLLSWGSDVLFEGISYVQP